MWQTAGDGTQNMNVLAEVDRPTDDNGANHGNQPPRYLVRNLLRTNQNHQHTERGGQGVIVNLFNLLDVCPDFIQGTVTAALQAEHAGYLTECDLNSNPGQKPDQHGTRQKICEEPEADNTRQYEQTGGHDREYPG